MGVSVFSGRTVTGMGVAVGVSDEIINGVGVLLGTGVSVMTINVVGGDVLVGVAVCVGVSNGSTGVEGLQPRNRDTRANISMSNNAPIVYRLPLLISIRVMAIFRPLPSFAVRQGTE